MPVKAVAILQARTSSSRLPSKALLPIAGYPSVVLSALRAANSGIPVLVATSTDASDDPLCSELARYHCSFVRGPLQDVLARFADAVRSLPDDTPIVRLTGDNTFPDGKLVDELVDVFIHSKLDYMDSSSPQNGLPYGLSAEVFRATSLHQANNSAINAYDREHVTPWIQRNCASGLFVPSDIRNLDFSYLRCTIDDKEDYERILRIFEGVDNPLQIEWQELMCRLNHLSGEPRFRIPHRVIGNQVHSEMTLGTAQLGMQYGIANWTGKPNEQQASQIVRRAIAHGVTTLDTARAYEDSEFVLGRSLGGAWRSRAEVITKLDLPATLSESAPASVVRAAVKASVHRSCEALQTQRLPTLLLHSWAHRRAWHEAAWKQLMELRDEGVIGKLGASVYEPWEAQAAFEDLDVLHLQIPYNILDWRWQSAGIDQIARGRPDVIVHARSALLQGVLALPPDRWPKEEGFDSIHCVQRLEEFAANFQRESIIDLCFAYVRSQSWICSVVVGCETEEQLDHNLEIFCKEKLSEKCCDQLKDAFSGVPASLLNPSNWRI